MTLLETSPADWLRALLADQPGIREAEFDVPPHTARLLVITASGQRFTVSLHRAGNYEQRG